MKRKTLSFPFLAEDQKFSIPYVFYYNVRDMSRKHRAIYYSVCGALIVVSLTGVAYSSYVLVTVSSQNVGVDVTASQVIENDGMIHGGSQSLSVRKALQFTQYGFVGENDVTSYDQDGTLQLNVPINLSKTKRSDAADSDGKYTYTFDIILSHSVTYEGTGVSGDVTSTSSAPDLVQYVTKVDIYDGLTSTTEPISSYDLTPSKDSGDYVYSAKYEDATITSSLTSGTLTNIYFEFTFVTSSTLTSSADFKSTIYDPYDTYITSNTENGYTYSYNFTLNWKKDS